MTTGTHLGDAELEHRLRAMLQRQAAGVRPCRASARRGDGAAAAGSMPVISLTRAHRYAPAGHRRRPLVAAAAAVIVLAAATLAISAASRGGNGTTTVGAPPIAASFASPGLESWDAATAPPVWPVVGEAALGGLMSATSPVPTAALSAPRQAAAAYLDTVAAPRAIELG